jgi:hypothetical protein
MFTFPYNYSTDSYYIPVQGSNLYSAIIHVAPSSTAALRNMILSINWYDAAYTNSAVSYSPVVIETNNLKFTPIYLQDFAPAWANIASLNLVIYPTSGSIPSGETHYVDGVGFFEGFNTVWSYPGNGVSSSKTLAYNAVNNPISAS